LIEKWTVIKPQGPSKGIVITLPGRCGLGSTFAKGYANTFIKAMVIGLTPRKLKWYPLPNGANDQDAAVNGIEKSRRAIDKVVNKIENKFGFKRNKIALVGFSAGAVMAIQVAAFSKNPFAAVVVHSGAILEPELLPACKHKGMPFILSHNKDDDCFSWIERYLPMKKALMKKNYRILKTFERKTGNHCIWEQDIKHSALILNKTLEENWFSRFRQYYIKDEI